VAEPKNEFPRYQVLRELGRGTTGVVYQVQDPQLRRVCALMVVDNDPAADFQLRFQRFRRAGRVLASLISPDIPALHEFSENHGKLYYVREFIEGSTLKQATGACSIDLNSGLRIIPRLALIVQWLHDSGFVHRNLNPDNVLVTPSRAPKLIGFCKAKQLDSSGIQQDARGLQELATWLCHALGLAVLPARLALFTAAGSFATASGFAAAIGDCLGNGDEQDRLSRDQ
jgi:serine/threonine-protein kinase